MASPLQPLINTNDDVKGNVKHLDPNAVVIIPAASRDLEPSPSSCCSLCGAKLVSESEWCQRCSYQSEQLVIRSHRPSPSHDRVMPYFEDDNPTCLYFCALFSLFAPIVGIFIILIVAFWRPRWLQR